MALNSSILIPVMNEKEKTEKKGTLYEYASLFAVFLIGLSLSTILYIAQRGLEKERIKNIFMREAVNRAKAIEHFIEYNLFFGIKGMEALYNASQEVTRDEFRNASNILLSYAPLHSVQALEWAPLVRDYEVADYAEKEAREGAPGIRITEFDKSGKLVDAAARSEYFPIDYVEPHKGNEQVLGFDLASDPASHAALELARDTGAGSLTERIRSSWDKADQYKVRLFYPIYKKGVSLNTVEERRNNLTGLVVGVFLVGDLLEKALANFKSEGIDIHLFDTSAPEEERFLYYRPSPLRTKKQPPESYELIQSIEGLRYIHTTIVANRKWVVAMTPVSDFEERNLTEHPLIILFGGLAATLLLCAYIWLILTSGARHRGIASKLLASTCELEKEITERKRAEWELQRAVTELQKTLASLKKTQHQLVRSEKLASLGALSAGVAHEIKNPLNIISAAVQLLMMQKDLPKDTKETCETIMEQVARTVKITENLRDFARDRKHEIKTIDIHKFLEKTISLLEYEMKTENIAVRKDFYDKPIFVKGDADQLAQVFLNIIGNARDSLNEKQQVYTAEELEQMGWKGEIIIRTRVDDSVARLVFEDTGLGIPERLKAKIFDPFFTTKEEGQGTGLGLAVAFGIIEEHGGSIEVDGREKYGAVFTITLPLSNPAAPEKPDVLTSL